MSASERMKALVKPFGKEGLALSTDLEIATPAPDEVLVKVITSSVCGTDLHIYKSDPSIAQRVADKRIIGHEFCGEVVAIGEAVSTHRVGDLIASESHIIDNTCYQCRHDQKHLCQNVSLVGVDRPGGLAQYVSIPGANAIVMTELIQSGVVSPEVACFMDAYGNAVDTATTVPLTARSVLITGTGPQGLMAIAVAAAAGAKQIIATEVAAERLEMARNVLATHAGHPNREDLVLDAKEDGVVDKVHEATGGLGVDALLEMSGHAQAIEDGLASLRNGGDAVILGVSSGDITLDWPALIFQGITIHFRYGRKLYQTWTDGMRLLQSGSVQLESLVHPTHFSLEEYEQAFGLLLSGKAAKIIFRPNG